MSKRIHKYILETTDSQVLSLPKGAGILKAAEQRDGICIWVEVDLKAELEDVEFRIFGTGHEVDIGAKYGQYIDTVFLGQYVWHVYVVFTTKQHWD